MFACTNIPRPVVVVTQCHEKKINEVLDRDLVPLQQSQSDLEPHNSCSSRYQCTNAVTKKRHIKNLSTPRFGKSPNMMCVPSIWYLPTIHPQRNMVLFEKTTSLCLFLRRGRITNQSVSSNTPATTLMIRLVSNARSSFPSRRFVTYLSRLQEGRA